MMDGTGQTDKPVAKAADAPSGGPPRGLETRRGERIDLLVGRHAALLSAQLQQHRERIFPPTAQKSLRKFTSGEVAELLGVKDAYLRKLHLDGRGPDPEVRGGGRRYYSAAEIRALREMLEEGAKAPGTYLPGAAPGPTAPPTIAR